MAVLGEDIYEYQFGTLYEHVKNLIGKSTIDTYDSVKEGEYAESNKYIGESNLLFDISGNDFKMYKISDSEYKYWVEVYVLKMIENLLARVGINYTEKYHCDCNEQHSIIMTLDGKKIESYFLFDMEYGESNRTDYDKIANSVIANADNVDKINIFIFRDRITRQTLAWLMEKDLEKFGDGLVEVFPLQHFFDSYFDTNEYRVFIKYADDFHTKCNSIISYKTVINPTQKTIAAFKQKKRNMLKDMDYRAISNKGKSGHLSETEFEKVRNSFLNNNMFTAMISSEDYADSFISSEWSYDVYSNAMGELELTGIVAGYLKSIEQLMYKITQFHRDQGLKIKTLNGFQPYTTDNEEIIDSTLWSLNEFVTSSKGKLAKSKSIRGCIHKAVDTWRQDERNGYFHKDNLYKSDNKIEEVRELTLYLYFLLLGGIEYTEEERQLLGVIEKCEKTQSSFNKEYEYQCFKRWLDNVYSYDLPKRVPGLWILLFSDKDVYKAHPYIMKYFNIEDFENGLFDFDPESIELCHTMDIPPFTFMNGCDNSSQASIRFQNMLEKYKAEYDKKMDRIEAIIIGIGNETRMIHFAQ